MTIPLKEAASRKARPEEVFRHVVCLGWYDGPLSGMLTCHDDLAEFRFDLVDDAADLDYRIFTIAPLPKGTIGTFVEMMKAYGHEPPRWPIWAPVWRFPSEHTADEARTATEELLQERSSPVAAFCWNVDNSTIIAYREFDESEQTPEDWFSWLALERPGPRSGILDGERD